MTGYIKLLIAAVLMAVSSLGTWYVTSDHYQKVAAQLKVKQDADSAKLIAHKDAQILQGATEHAINQDIINSLSDSVHANSVRIHIPVSCGDTKGSASQDEARRVFSEGVDELFSRLQERVGVLVREADQINIDVIQQDTGIK
jgi:hypothetical protein